MDRIEKIIIEFNNKFMNYDEDKIISLGLFDGKMGISIYYYYQYSYYNSLKYKKYADLLFNNVIKDLNLNMNSSLQTGLSGILLGIMHLIDKGFITGETIHTFNEADDKIFKDFNNLLEKEYLDINDLYEVLVFMYYFVKRLAYKNSTETKFIFENILIKAINKIETADFNKYNNNLLFSLNRFSIVFYLYLLIEIKKLSFYNYKIERILKLLSNDILSYIPYLHSERLLLAYLLNIISEETKNTQWKYHADLLFKNTDINLLVKQEYKNKQLFLSDGLCGFYWSLNKFEANNKTLNKLILNKIISSELFIDEGVFDPYTLKPKLFYGYPGVFLTYQHLTKSL